MRVVEFRRGSEMRKKRVQEGIIHVYVRGNGRFRVFYDDEDCIIFLKKCDRFARKHNTKILEFVLMINHVHLLVQTYNLSIFMKELLHSYSVWYNRKYKHSNKIFRTPFSSVNKKSEEWILQNSIYILQNPVKSDLVTKAEAYTWSSFLFHFPDKDKRIRNRLEKYIVIETLLVDSFFKNYIEFSKNVNTVIKDFGSPGVRNGCWEKISYSDLSRIATEYIKPRKFSELSVQQVDELILYLAGNTNASLVNIASLVHENYDYVRKLVRRTF